jgi:dihydrofolate synthase / folylpolyglutamate synthase
LSLEHWQRLGPTVADIAREKAGILKADCPAIVGVLPPDAERVIRERIESLGCPAVWPEAAEWVERGKGAAGFGSAQPARLVKDCALSRVEGHNLGWELPWAIADNLSYPLPLLGDMQLMNSALAIATLKALRQQGWTISNEAIQIGMAKTQWPGRLQWTQWQGMKLLIDGAHNPAAAKVLRQYVDRLAPTPVHWLMGMLSTKDHADIFQALLRKGDHLTLVPVPEHSTADPLQLGELARSICPDLESCDTAVDLVEGLQLLQEKASGLKILCGSLYLVGEFLAL